MTTVSNILFQDSQDPTRFLRIVEEKDKTVVVKIFFGPDKNSLTYSGKVEMGKALFYPDGGTRVGFNPARDPAPPAPPRENRYSRDRDREERYDDRY